MDTSVCHCVTYNATYKSLLGWTLFILISAAALVEGQTSGAAWRKLGSSAVETGLAGPAGGPVLQVWFSEDGTKLFAKTAGRGVFVTADFDSWTVAQADAIRREPILEHAPARLPESQANLREGGSGRLYSFGQNVYGSEDGGRTWVNLTAFLGRSVIGEGQHDVAVSPRDPLFVAVGNDAGVWTSHDGGLSWNGLNEGLPNLAVRALLPGNRIAVERAGIAAWEGRSGWVSGGEPAPEVAMRAEVGSRLGVAVVALSGAGDFWYAGSTDGRVWTSADARAHWTLSTIQTVGPVERFFLDADAPRIAFVAAAGHGPHLFRTVNGGLTWYDITGSLADMPAHGVAADRAGGAVYVATDRGIFLSRMDLNVLGTASAWVNVSQNLPAAAVEDVRLDATGRQLTAAVDGYGVYVSRAPHQTASGRLVNAADLSGRAAAPGGLVSALGISVDSAIAGGRQFPVLARSAEGSQIQVPFGTEPAEIALQLNQGATVKLMVKSVAPAVFIDRGGAPLLLDPETGMMLDGSQPTQARALVQLLATGLGKVTPEWPTGMPAPFASVPAVAAEVRAYLNGVPVEVTKATLAPGYVGMYLVEIRIPALLDAGPADLYLEAGGESSNHVRISVSY